MTKRGTLTAEKSGQKSTEKVQFSPGFLKLGGTPVQGLPQGRGTSVRTRKGGANEGQKVPKSAKTRPRSSGAEVLKYALRHHVGFPFDLIG